MSILIQSKQSLLLFISIALQSSNDEIGDKSSILVHDPMSYEQSLALASFTFFEIVQPFIPMKNSRFQLSIQKNNWNRRPIIGKNFLGRSKDVEQLIFKKIVIGIVVRPTDIFNVLWLIFHKLAQTLSNSFSDPASYKKSKSQDHHIDEDIERYFHGQVFTLRRYIQHDQLINCPWKHLNHFKNYFIENVGIVASPIMSHNNLFFKVGKIYLIECCLDPLSNHSKVLAPFKVLSTLRCIGKIYEEKSFVLEVFFPFKRFPYLVIIWPSLHKNYQLPTIFFSLKIIFQCSNISHKIKCHLQQITQHNLCLNLQECLQNVTHRTQHPQIIPQPNKIQLIMSTAAQRRLLKDLKRIQSEAGDDIIAAPKENCLLKWTATIEGVEQTPWEGGLFQLKLDFTESYPNKPPSVKFTSQMFHPNIYNDGRICLDMLQNQWSPVYDVWSILTAIRMLLADPNTLSPANCIASRLFKQNKALYEKRVREIVEKSLQEKDEDEIIEEEPQPQEEEDQQGLVIEAEVEEQPDDIEINQSEEQEEADDSEGQRNLQAALDLSRNTANQRRPPNINWQNPTTFRGTTNSNIFPSIRPIVQRQIKNSFSQLRPQYRPQNRPMPRPSVYRATLNNLNPLSFSPQLGFIDLSLNSSSKKEEDQGRVDVNLLSQNSNSY